MVSGKPYISVNNATIKAENTPKLRQSVFDFGLTKLNAKKINIAELMMTNVQSP